MTVVYYWNKIVPPVLVVVVVVAGGTDFPYYQHSLLPSYLDFDSSRCDLHLSRC
jgi:hypothetical protein